MHNRQLRVQFHSKILLPTIQTENLP